MERAAGNNKSKIVVFLMQNVNSVSPKIYHFTYPVQN